MLKITNTSTNVDGIIEINNTEIANINGSINSDNVYINFNAYDVKASKDNKDQISTDIAEFVDAVFA